MKECLRIMLFCLLFALSGIAYDVSAKDSDNGLCSSLQATKGCYPRHTYQPTSKMPTNAYKRLLNAYESKGYYQGGVDRHGRVYDRRGMYHGKVNKKGVIYDRRGRYMGRVE